MLWGGQNLTVRSTNASVIPNDGFGETMSRSDGLRYLLLFGKAFGNSKIEASFNGAPWCVLDVWVAHLDATANPVKPDPFTFEVPFSSGPGGLFPVSGSVPMSIGAPAMVRIPVPGTRNLCIEFSPRNYKGTSTSTLFIQDASGKIHLRLDYGYNTVAKTVDYHWNLGGKQKGGMKADFGIADHQPVDPGGERKGDRPHGFHKVIA